MDQTTKKPFQGSISKLLVMMLLIIIIIGAAVFLWLSFKSESATNNASDTSQSTGTGSITNSSSTVTDTSGVTEEINTLDQALTELDDDALADTEISDSNLGI